jgi:twitching motility two-component system response regulator PilH
MEARSKILIVDDDPLIRSMIKILFQEDVNQYEVLEAGDVGKALDVAVDNRPHLIITDVLMPRLSGFDLIVAVRSNPLVSHIPILVCSAKQPPVDRECMEMGANGYLSKPLNMDVLLRTAKGLLGYSTA